MTTAESGLGRELVALARPLAIEVASQLEAALDRAGPTISTKSTDTDLVTDMDRWAERRITERILAVRPTDSIIGEEGASVQGTSEVTWSVDPIDGTVNFVHGIPGFCVSIAARVGSEAVAAVVVSPLHRDVFHATAGGGAFRNDRPMRCAAPTTLGRSVLGTGFGYDPARRRRQAEVLTRVITEIADIRRGGAAAVDLCSVACGRLDGYWEVGLNDWDHAAGALLVAEAGGRVAGLDGEPPSEKMVVAAPAETWSTLRDLLESVDAAAV